MPGLSEPKYSDPNCLRLRHEILAPSKLIRRSSVCSIRESETSITTRQCRSCWRGHRRRSTHPWHRQPKRQTQIGGQHLVSKHSDVLGIVLELGNVTKAVRSLEFMPQKL